MKKLLILILLIGCEKYEYTTYEVSPLQETTLLVYSDLPYENNIYIFDYPEGFSNCYFKIHYDSFPYQRVFWDSPDEFYVVMWNDTIWTPVINFSTYADEDGWGHQMVYVNPTLIGDTLNLIGTISEENYKEILVKIQ
tara:strand:+ start:52 stop:465 length:414 start_codon:yes stop_codon:yes gene_type:complete